MSGLTVRRRGRARRSQRPNSRLLLPLEVRPHRVASPAALGADLQALLAEAFGAERLRAGRAAGPRLARARHSRRGPHLRPGVPDRRPCQRRPGALRRRLLPISSRRGSSGSLPALRDPRRPSGAVARSPRWRRSTACCSSGTSPDPRSATRQRWGLAFAASRTVPAGSGHRTTGPAVCSSCYGSTKSKVAVMLSSACAVTVTSIASLEDPVRLVLRDVGEVQLGGVAPRRRARSP